MCPLTPTVNLTKVPLMQKGSRDHSGDLGGHLETPSICPWVSTRGGGGAGGYYRTLTNGDLLYFFTAMLLKRSRHRSDEPQKIKTTFLIKVSVFPLLQTDNFDKYLIYTVL